MAPRIPKTPSSEQMPAKGKDRRERGPNYAEFGALGLKHTGGFVREEYLTQLQGPTGMRVLREMSDNDPIVGGFIFAVEQACRQVDWKVIPATNTDEATKYANFVDSCRMDMSMTWGDVVTEALSFLVFGWSLLEVTYKIRRGFVATERPDANSRYEDGLIGWRKFAPRGQESLRRWIYDDVDKDKLIAMQQFTVEKGMVDVPLSRCLHFRTKSFKNNPEGRSMLRNAYRSWYLKKRIEEIEGIGIERDMAGLPVLVAPEHSDLWNPNDPKAVVAKKSAEEIVRNIRMDEQMGVLLPFGWELKLLATGGKRAINTTDVINRYNQTMAMTVLADFILLGHQSRLGSFALAKSKTSMFAMSLVGYLNVMRDTINTYELPRLWRMNGFPMELMPRLDYTPVDTPPLRDLAAYLSVLSSAALDFSPPELQRYLFQLAGIPKDITDLAGRGGTGEGDPGNLIDEEVEPNVYGDPMVQGDDEEDDDEDEQPGVQPPNVAGGGRPTPRTIPTARRTPSPAARGVRSGSPDRMSIGSGAKPKPRLAARAAARG